MFRNLRGIHPACGHPTYTYIRKEVPAVDPHEDARHSAKDQYTRESVVGWRWMKPWQIWTIAIAAVAAVVAGVEYV